MNKRGIDKQNPRETFFKQVLFNFKDHHSRRISSLDELIIDNCQGVFNPDIDVFDKKNPFQIEIPTNKL